MSHLEERLERDLKRIHDRLAIMAEQVQEAVKNSVHALQTGNTKLAYTTVLNDNVINRSMREIDKICHSFFAIHIPTGAHLRLLSSVIRVNIELERIGDYAVTIARGAAQCSPLPSSSLSREVDRIASETMLMLRQSIKAFNDLNAEMAKSTMVMANEMENNLDTVYAEMMANEEELSGNEVITTFTICTQLKRISDQAKNLCEDTVFAVTGEQKPATIFNILFVDEDNSCLSQLAEAIARKNHPGSGVYLSAGNCAARALNPTLISFLEKRGIDISPAELISLDDLTPKEISSQHVIVSLQGSISSHFPKVPFHSTALEWDLGPAPEAGNEQAYEALYREIAMQIKDLIEVLLGEGAN